MTAVDSFESSPYFPGIVTYYDTKLEELNQKIAEKTHTIRRLEAQRNELNSQGTARSHQHFAVVIFVLCGLCFK